MYRTKSKSRTVPRCLLSLWLYPVTTLPSAYCPYIQLRLRYVQGKETWRRTKRYSLGTLKLNMFPKFLRILLYLNPCYTSYSTYLDPKSYPRLGSDRNFGSVRGSADFGRFCSVRFGKNFCRAFCHSVSCSLTIYGYKADRLCNSLQQIVFSVTAKFHNTYLDNSVLRCKTFGLLRGRILYSCFDFIVLAKLYMLRLRFFET